MTTHPPYYQGWPLEAIDLIEQAAFRHGGWELWKRLNSIHFRFQCLMVPLPALKGQNRTFSLPPLAQVFPHECRVVFQDPSKPGVQGLFEKGDVRILSHKGSSLEAVKEGKDPRKSFLGLAKYRRWNDLDAVYFFGYALVNYLSLPFLLRKTSFVSLHKTRWGKDLLKGLTVDFPEGFPTHSRRQSFFFDPTSLLR